MYEDSDEDTEETALLRTEPPVADNSKNSALDPPLGGVEGLLDQDLYDVEESPVDYELEKLWYQDFERLARSQKDLLLKVRDPKLTVVLHSQIASMAGTLNLYLDETLPYTWRQASELALTAQGKGTSYARQIQTWIHTYLDEKKLPKDNYGATNNSLLADEDFAQSIQLYLLEISKGGYISAKDVVAFVATEEMQEKIKKLSGNGAKAMVSMRTAHQWLGVLNWWYGKKKRGMYIDGHEQEDVVKYQDAFIKWWKEKYEPRMVLYDDDGKVLKTPNGFPIPQGAQF